MEINIVVDESVELPFRVDWLWGVAGHVLSRESPGAAVELGLVVTGQEQVRQLNRDYRGRDETTDVLAFSVVEEAGAGFPPFVPPPDGVRHLGEVIISYPQAVVQAEERGHSVEREMAILVIHGVLHLLGYDHEEPEAERRMGAREAEVLSHVGGLK
jgi:probable rRNA maturation factor